MGEFTATALGIGRRIAAEAIWHRERCNWVAPQLEDGGGSPDVVFAALSADLYSGTAGVALVLAEIFAETGEASIRRASLGAARQAIASSSRIAPELAIGLYTGQLGAALASIRCGSLLGEAELLEAGHRLVRGLRETATEARRHDLIGGRAGAVVGLLAASVALGLDELVSWAVDLGDELLAAARITDGWFWPHPTITSAASLTGLSHGAAGIAYALIELHAATAERRFRDAAEGAIAYEQAHFDPRAENWEDSLGEESPRPGSRRSRSPVFWCHGAPGIALSRYRVRRTLGGHAGSADVAAGLRTTARWSRAALHGARGSFCLCHGLAGNAEILLECADAAGADEPALRTLARDIARFGVDEWARPGRAWPCGTPGGESPGLMLGLAGTARFYLRLDDPTLPSLLLPQPSAWGQHRLSEPGPMPGRRHLP